MQVFLYSILCSASCEMNRTNNYSLSGSLFCYFFPGLFLGVGCYFVTPYIETLLQIDNLDPNHVILTFAFSYLPFLISMYNIEHLFYC